MDWLHALILGIVQGLTEYLPVSSSGHLEIGKALLGPEAEAGGLTFDIVVHVATVLSTLVILWKEVIWIFGGLFSPFKNVPGEMVFVKMTGKDIQVFVALQYPADDVCRIKPVVKDKDGGCGLKGKTAVEDVCQSHVVGNDHLLECKGKY